MLEHEFAFSVVCSPVQLHQQRPLCSQHLPLFCGGGGGSSGSGGGGGDGGRVCVFGCIQEEEVTWIKKVFTWIRKVFYMDEENCCVQKCK